MSTNYSNQGEVIQHLYTEAERYRTNRFYMLTTANMDSADWEGINAEINKIEHIHGCQVIVNGVFSTLRYYLRLLNDPAEFIDRYVELLKSDETIKYPQLLAWNNVTSYTIN